MRIKAYRLFFILASTVILCGASLEKAPNSQFYKWKTFIYLNFQAMKADPEKSDESRALKDLLCIKKLVGCENFSEKIIKSQTPGELIKELSGLTSINHNR